MTNLERAFTMWVGILIGGSFALLIFIGFLAYQATAWQLVVLVIIPAAMGVLFWYHAAAIHAWLDKETK